MRKDNKSGSSSDQPNFEASPGRSPGLLTLITEVFGISRTVSISVFSFVGLVVLAAIFYSVASAPPTTLTITSGPEGSIFYTNACKYAANLARYGVTAKVLPSHGSLENLQRLSDPTFRVDVGLVQGGVTNAAMDKLFSLGSISHQPLLVFSRVASLELLSGLAGKRVVVGPEGSGTRSLALALLDANGIKVGGTNTLLDWEPKVAYQALIEGRVDAVFLMGEDASSDVLRALLRSPDIHLFNFKQAVAYSRRLTFLSVLELPEGSMDFGKNIPSHEISLIGPTVELVARPGLHPAISDLLLDAAREVHGKPTLLQRKGEFPAPLEHDFPISPDATRFYKSGKTFFYRYLPFWLASFTSRVVLVFLPMVVVMIPLVRSIPHLYFWRVRTLIYRWYRALLAVERELLHAAEPPNGPRLIKRLDEIERAVNKMRIPASYADQFYSLRGHIDFVRNLVAERAAK